jgi:hypothetical protein
MPRVQTGPMPGAGYAAMPAPGSATPSGGHGGQPAPGWGGTVWSGLAEPGNWTGQADWAEQADWAGTPDNMTVWDVDLNAGSWDYDQPPWDGGAPEPNPDFRYRQPGPGMPGYRGPGDMFYGGDLQ